jgi:hypothetical protein
MYISWDFWITVPKMFAAIGNKAVNSLEPFSATYFI